MQIKTIKFVILVIIAGLVVTPGWLEAQANQQFAAEVISLPNSITVKAGLTGEFEVVVRNTGIATWTNDGPNAVKLGTVQPQDHASQFYHASWLSPNRVATMQEATVASNETAHFVFTVTAAGFDGSVVEHLGLVAEGITWFEQVSIPLTINIQPAIFAAQLVQQSVVSLELKTHETADIAVQFENLGDVVWSNSSAAAVKVSTTMPPDRSSNFQYADWLSANRITSADADVAPGEVGVFNFKLQAPDQIGSFTEHFGLVAEGVAWFDVKFVLNIEVVPAIYDAKWLRQSNNTVSLSPDGTKALWVEFTNTGNTVWTSSGDNAIKLGTSRSLDRESIFYNTSWPGSNRVAAMTPAEVGPGETARFTFTIRAPDLVGTKHREYFRPVVEMVTWLPDWGVYWDISIDEELVLVDAMRVGLTSTTQNVTVWGPAFVIRRGSDKQLVRRFGNQPVTISALGYGYSLSTGEQVSDYLRIIPLNDGVLTIQTSGIGSTYNTFRGIVEIRRSPVTGNIWVVNVLELEDYMKGVAEVPDSWPAEAQKAQMVAARTFAVKKRLDSTSRDIFDVYDDTRHQVYYGYNYEISKPNLTVAAQATKGLVIKYQNQPISAFYFSDSGGYTASVENVWGRGDPARAIPYLKGMADPYAKPIEWNYTLTQDYLRNRFDDTLGIAGTGSDVIDKIEVTERFPSNRAKTVVFTMRSGRTIAVPFYTFDYLTNNNEVRSMNFIVQAVGLVDNPDFMFTGKGWGHGVGLPQWGTRNMADAGKDFRQILTYYYTGVVVTTL